MSSPWFMATTATTSVWATHPSSWRRDFTRSVQSSWINRLTKWPNHTKRWKTWFIYSMLDGQKWWKALWQQNLLDHFGVNYDSFTILMGKKNPVSWSRYWSHASTWNSWRNLGPFKSCWFSSGNKKNYRFSSCLCGLDFNGFRRQKKNTQKFISLTARLLCPCSFSAQKHLSLSSEDS